MSSTSNYGRSCTSIASLDTNMRSTRPKTATSVASSASIPTTSSHPYLGDGKVTAIESWTASIPNKKAHGSTEDIDPVVQAYLETKMALFRNAARQSSLHIATGPRKQ